LLFLAAYAIPIIDPRLPRAVGLACYWVGWLTWLLFVGDYLIRLFLAEDRRRYLLRHWIDLLVVALPLLRPLRLLRLVPLISVLNRRASSLLRGRVAIYVAVGSSLIGFVAALAVLSAERGRPNANIENFGDAIWWSAETMTTVGYGDKYPVTALGRTIAVGLMICGIALLGTVTATLASWLVEHVSAVEASEHTRLMARIDRLEAKLDAVLPPGGRGPDPADPPELTK
jgi:voltage-gated potassium channel